MLSVIHKSLYGLSLTIVLCCLAACGGAASSPTPVPLSQTFTSGDGTITLSYPAGWTAQDLFGQVTVANNAAAIEAAVPSPGQFQARLFATPVSAIQGLAVDATPRDVLQFFAESLSTSGVTFNPATDLTINGHPAARIEGSGTDGQAIVLAVNLGEGNYVFVSATSAPGEISRFEPTLIAILGTLTYTPLVPETTPAA